MSLVKLPLIIDWAVTPRCDLSCRHCRGMAQGELTTERARKLIGEIAGLHPGWVIVEGGEPLLREDLFELLELMRQEPLEVHLITNGMILDEHIIANLKELGVRVMVSVDAATPALYEAIRRGASFDKVLRSAHRYAEEGLLESLNFTLQKSNYTEIPGIFRLASSLRVPRVTIIGLKPCQDYLGELLSPQEYQEAISLACRAAQETGTEFFFDEPFFWATVKEWGLAAKEPAVSAGILHTATTACIFGEYLFIEPDGLVKPCSFSPLAVGSVAEKTLGEIWSEMLASPFFHQLKDPKTRTGYCQSCRYLEDCKGCRSRTFVLTGDWFAADPCCPLSLKLVPEGI